MKNHAADPEIGFLTKLISKPNGCTTAMPTAWVLNGANPLPSYGATITHSCETPNRASASLFRPYPHSLLLILFFYIIKMRIKDF